MEKYLEDEINFHGFLRALRHMQKVSLRQLSEGLFSVSKINRIETGLRLPGKLVRDRIVARLGVSSEEYEDYLSKKEYKEWQLRQNIIKAIERKDINAAEEYICKYEKKNKLDCIELQFLDAMHFMVLQIKAAPVEELRAVIKRAVMRTMPDIKKALSGKMLLAEQEIHLLIEFVKIEDCSWVDENEIDWRINQYESLITYIENSHIDHNGKAKVYPKVVYYLARILLEHDRVLEKQEYILEKLNNAVEILRDARKMYDFVELLETRKNVITYIMNSDTCKKMLKEELSTILEKNNEWCVMLIELYEENGVSPYMENFCHLYWETECHHAGKVIRARRQMFGLTQPKLAGMVCDIKTVYRVENGQTIMQMPIMRDLFNDLGLCAEYTRARVVTSDYNTLLVATQLVRHINNREFDKWEECIETLKETLCVEIPHNKQQIIRMENLLQFRRGHINKTEFAKKNIELLECTLPLDVAMSNSTTYFTQAELACIYNIAMHGEGNTQQKCYKIIEGLCDYYASHNGLGTRISIMELLTNGLVSYLGNTKRYGESSELCSKMLKECLIQRRMNSIVNFIYNNIWNYKEQQIDNEQCDSLYLEKGIKMCITMCDLNKRNKAKTFFQQKLIEWSK